MIINATSAIPTIGAIQGALKVITMLQLTASGFPDQSCVFDVQPYDYIIVGAGTAGSTLANRLVEDNKTTVLLIESGANPQLESTIPALMLYLKSGDATWNYTVQDSGPSKKSQQPTKDDLSIGKVLGGSSSSSYLVYTSGSKHDYNNWAKIVNDTIWNWENVLPYLKKSQRLEDSELSSTDGEFYGQNGNVGLIVLRSSKTIKSEPFFKAFNELGYKTVPSVNGNISLGYSSAIFTISNNVRQSTAVSYLSPIINNPNLHVLKNTIVTKIIFDSDKNAIGVKAYTCNARHIVIRARKEVIVSAGIINTPKLLMLSGIGPKKQLCKHKIHTISDLPVGEGLQDHLGVAVVYNMTKLVVPYRPFNPNKYPAVVITGYVALNKSEDYPDYQSVNYINYPINLIKYCTFTYSYNDSICNNQIATNVNSQMMYTIINKQKSMSRGKVILKSTNFRDDPLIYTNDYSNKQDLEDFAKIVQDFMRVGETKAFKKLGGKFKDPILPACNKFDKKDLEYWKCYVLYMTTSQHQYSSTCPLGTVVDSRLRVLGVKRLRVVDASVMPNPTAGGTLGSTIMIGEKAADLIKEDNH